MKESKANPNRIPASQSETWQSWTMPVIGDDGQVLSAEKQRQAQGEGESVEDIEVDALPERSNLTAEQLAEIVRAAESEGFTQGHSEGVKSGFDEGFKSGQQQGLLEMRQQLIAEQKTFQSLAASLFEPIEQQDDMLEALMLTTIERLTRAVVMRELATDPGELVALVRQAVVALPAGRDKIKVELNPDDLAVVESYCEEHALDWSFHGNPDLSVGGVKVLTADSTVDYSVERRLNEIIEAFLLQQNVDENTSNEDLLEATSKIHAGASTPEDQVANTAPEPHQVAEPSQPELDDSSVSEQSNASLNPAQPDDEGSRDD